MKSITFASRNFKEIIRDPLTLIFGAGLPIVLILFISILEKSIPEGANAAFRITNFAPSMAVFSFSFVSLFTGLLISGDRKGMFIVRLYASPMKPADFILGYMLPLIPIALAQGIVCFLAAFVFGLKPTWNVIPAVLLLIPSAFMYTGFGLLFGTLFSDKQLGGIFSIFVNLTTWLSGTWFDLRLIGGAFKTIGEVLPFSHAVYMAQAALGGNIAGIFPHIWVVLGYALVVIAASILLFKKRMRV